MKPDLPHLRISKPTNILGFSTRSRGGSDKELTSKDRKEHAAFLKQALLKALQQSEQQTANLANKRNGFYLEFKSNPDLFKAQSFENLRSGIRLCNLQVEQKSNLEDSETPALYATLFVKEEKKDFFLTKIELYETETTRKGNPKHQTFITSIDGIKAAKLHSFWTDDQALMPSESRKWCEVWLRQETGKNQDAFITLLDKLNIPQRPERLRFPERTVLLIYATSSDLESLLNHSGDIAEYRLAKTTNDFWSSTSNAEQSQWAEDFYTRLKVERESLNSILILDTGVNFGHPLLNNIIDYADCQSSNPNWSTTDEHGHGTKMAGVCAFGNISAHLESTGAIEVQHVLESVKIKDPKTENEPELYGEITKRAVSLAEIQAPDRSRIICMAVTAPDTSQKGRPSSWSSALDDICFGDEDNKRLFLVSAGNCNGPYVPYPDRQLEESVQDPAQSWNALTIGAYTQLTDTTKNFNQIFSPIAGVNELSPFSTTSRSWVESTYPIKPEILFEGGNAATEKIPDYPGMALPNLSLLSLHHKPNQYTFEDFAMTSVATAQAANFAAKIQTAYPNYWPETIRALMVHSAEWPQQLKDQFLKTSGKKEMLELLKTCGYGVPDLQRALSCASNSLTLVAEAELQPYSKSKNTVTTKDMHLYKLPWPSAELLGLDSTEVQMRGEF